MTTLNLSPLLRSSVGFDNLFRLAEGLGNVDIDHAYPPYNIEKTGEEDYRITMAVAGFSDDELEIETVENQLRIAGRAAPGAEERTFLHRGIAKRAFERGFQLADTIRVVGARFENGLLEVDLVREIPEHKRPRRIEIGTGRKAKVLTGEKAA